MVFDAETDAYKLSWCQYGGGEDGPRCRELLLARAEVRQARPLDLAFSQLAFQRLIVEQMPRGAFDDRFVRFLCRQLEACAEFAPLQLTLRNVDLGQLSSDVLKALLNLCSARLEVLEFFDVDNLAPGLLTDEHVLLLGKERPVRRLSIQPRDSEESAATDPADGVQVGDTSLEAFAERGLFPAFTMGRCMVTAPAVCNYVNEWLQRAARSELIKAHALNLSDCPRMCAREFEEECARLGLSVAKHSTEDVSKFPCFETAADGTLTSFTVHGPSAQQQFQINLFTIKN